MEKNNQNERRQSLGRKVSFADTATIRLFELPLNANSTNNESNCTENSSPNEIFALSPLKEASNNKQRSLLGAKNESFSSDVTLQLQTEENELSSDCETAGQMELTSRVGEILSEEHYLNQEMQIDFLNHQPSSPVSMEMTACVGEILQQIPPPQNQDCEMEMTVCVGELLNPVDEEMLQLGNSNEQNAKCKELENQSNLPEQLQQQPNFQSYSNQETNIVMNHQVIDESTLQESIEVGKESKDVVVIQGESHFQMPQEMEMTTCIGKIIQESNPLELAACLGNIVKESNVVEMEMTTSVGTILAHHSGQNHSQMEMTTSVGEMLSQLPESFSHENHQEMLLSSSLGPVDESILNEINNIEEQTFDELIDSKRFKEERTQSESMEFTQAVGQLIPNDSFEIPSFLYQIDNETSFIASGQDAPKETIEKNNVNSSSFQEDYSSQLAASTNSNPKEIKDLQSETNLSVDSSVNLLTKCVEIASLEVSRNENPSNEENTKNTGTQNSHIQSNTDSHNQSNSDSHIQSNANSSIQAIPNSNIQAFSNSNIQAFSNSNIESKLGEKSASSLKNSSPISPLALIKHSFPIPPDIHQKENSFTNVFDEKNLLSSSNLNSFNSTESQSSASQGEAGESSANLKEFLERIDVRFLDNIKSKARRETIARNIKMEGMTLASQAFVKSALLPQLENLEKACSFLENHMEKKRTMISLTEKAFNANPPKFYQDFEKNKDSSLAQIKTFKSTARSNAKHEWRKFRLALCNDIHERLSCESQRAKVIEEKIDHISALLSQELQRTSSLLAILQQDCLFLQEKDSKFANYDANLDKINAITAELEVISAKKHQLEQDLIKLTSTRQNLQEEYSYELRKGSTFQLCIEQSKGLLQQHKIIDDAVLNQEREKLNLLCKLFGFTPIRIKREAVEIALPAGFSIVFSLGSEGELLDISSSCTKDKAKLLVLILKNRIFNGKKTTYFLHDEFERIGLLCCRYNKMLCGPITQLQCKYVLEPDYERLCFVVRKRNGEKIVLFFDEPLTQIANLNKI